MFSELISSFFSLGGWIFGMNVKELTPEEKSLVQKGPKFASSPATIPVKEYISYFTVVALQVG